MNGTDKLELLHARLRRLAAQMMETAEWRADGFTVLEAAAELVKAAEAVEDLERYRWFRAVSEEQKVWIAELAGSEWHLLDHFIDKGRVGL